MHIAGNCITADAVSNGSKMTALIHQDMEGSLPGAFRDKA